MRDAVEIVVLKAGGSVLRTNADYARIAHSIYDHVRAGRKVVAVVSAREGRTERLLRRARGIADTGTSGTVARLLSTGEHASAAMLELFCARAGLDVGGLDAQALGIETIGDAVDGAWIALHPQILIETLERHDVVVVPGFIARDAWTASLTLLGRGGSDLSAFAVASMLRTHFGAARVDVELLKDVDGLFSADPHVDPTALRYASASYDALLREGGGLVQQRALVFARGDALEFTLRAPLSNAGTRIVAGDSIVAPARPRVRPLRVLLLGCGIVGEGVLRALLREPDLFAPVGILVRDARRERARDLPRDLFSTDVDALLARDADVVVEAVGGIAPLEWLSRALRAGRHVVTANKELAARHGRELAALASEHGVTLSISACVGGAAPMLEAIGRAHGRVVAIEGIVNATANVVLDALARGATLADAVDRARARGLAEADPSRDLDGTDAAEKLVLLMRAAALDASRVESIRRDAIDATIAGRARAAQRRGRRLRQLATWSGAGPRVQLVELPEDHPLARIDDASVALAIEDERGKRIVARGIGAGRWPTTQAIIGDLLAVVRRHAVDARGTVVVRRSPFRPLSPETSIMASRKEPTHPVTKPTTPAPKDALQGAFEQAGTTKPDAKSSPKPARPSKPPEDVDQEDQDDGESNAKQTG